MRKRVQKLAEIVSNKYKKLVEIVSYKSEVKDFIWYSLTILLASGSGIVLGSVKSGMMSQTYGVSNLNIYFMVANLIGFFSGIITFYGSGLCSIISRDLAMSDLSQIGKRVNINNPLNLVFTGVIALLLWLLRDSFLQLYLIPESDKEFANNFYNLYLSLVPVFIFNIINGFTILGFHGLFLKMVFDISGNAMEVVALLLFIDYGYGIESVIYTSYVRWIILLLQIVWIYQPKHLTRYRLFTREMWNFQSYQFWRLFAVDSTFLIIRGIIMMVQYMAIPFVVSHLGTYQLAAYSFMNSLFFYSDMIGDVIGSACLLKGSHYLGLKIHSLYRQMLKVVSLVAVGLSFLLLIVLFFGKDLIFQLFTTENRVHMEIDQSYPYYLFLIFLGPIVGIVEGFMLARQNFLELFAIMLVAAIMWASIIAINMEIFRNLSLIWIAHSIMLWTRFFGSAVIIALETYQEWSLPDEYQEETFDTEIEELKEGEKTPLVYSM